MEPEQPETPVVEPLNITLTGGDALDLVNGQGGYGGALQLGNVAGGDVQLLATGTVDTTVSLPTSMPYLGTNWQDITADTTLKVAEAGFRLVQDSEQVLDENGQEVTGIRVRPGVTLTIEPNQANGYGGNGSIEILLDDGLIVEGTIKTTLQDGTTGTPTIGDKAGLHTAPLSIDVSGGVYVGAQGKIDLSGVTRADGYGGNGGGLSLEGETINNLGTIITSGGSGSLGGGSGGSVGLVGPYGYAVTTGTITMDGGTSGAGYGGNGGNLFLGAGFAQGGFVVMKGVVSATGANGGYGGGGGGSVQVAGYGGAVVDGTIANFGGDAATNGFGGSGGSVLVDGRGTIRLAGSLDMHGGSSAGEGWQAGRGGSLVLSTMPYTTYMMGTIYVPDSLGIFVGAEIVANGGKGAWGGNGGTVIAQNLSTYNTSITSNPIMFVGYGTVESSGGNGAYGGWAATPTTGGPYVGLTQNSLVAYPGTDANEDFYHCGGVTNEADFVMRGGASAAATSRGGNGGALTLATTMSAYAPYTYRVVNSGSVTAPGGDGVGVGGTGGGAYFWGYYGLETSGDILVSGGNASGAGYGGYAGTVDFMSGTSLTSSGAITANGGNSESGLGGSLYGGGSPDNVIVGIRAGGLASVTGAISTDGGDTTSGQGGDGGSISVFSIGGASTVGALSVAAGTGTIGTPIPGWIFIDGTAVSGPDVAVPR